MKELRVAIVGFGGMGQGHARSLAQIEGMSLVAVSDPSPDARAKASGLGLTTFDRHAEMMDCLELDGVIVSSPSNIHGEVVIDCCWRHINAFCEKPLTTTFSEALDVEREVRKSGICFSIGLVLRHSEMYKRARHMIEAGEIGEVKMAQCRYGGYMIGKYEYVFSKVLGRGLINEHTIHMIDAMQYILGPVDEVYARTDASDEHTEYNAGVLMVHETGAFTSLAGSGVSRLSGFARITGTDGELLVEGNRSLLHRDETGEREILAGELGYRAELEDFRDAILHNRNPHTGIEAAMECSRLIEAVYRSAEGRVAVRPVEL